MNARLTLVVLIVASTLQSARASTPVLATQASTGGNPKSGPKPLEKIPKSLFLVKKLKLSPDVGEPQFNPQEAQLRTVINDPVLHSTKKFE